MNHHSITADPSFFRFEPSNFGEAMSFAETVVESGLIPHLKRPEEVFILLATGAELGLSSMQSLRSIHIINGKISLSSDILVGMVKKSSTSRWFRVVETSDRSATYETLRRGEKEPVRHTFSIEDARRAGLTRRTMWQKYPAAMLRARCSGALAKMVYPDLLTGLVGDEQLPYRAPRSTPEPKESIQAPLAPLPWAKQAAQSGIVSPLERLQHGASAPPSASTLRRPHQPHAPARRARRSSLQQAHANPSPKPQLLQQARRARCLELNNMTSQEAARHVAGRLASRGLYSQVSTAMQALVNIVEKRGLQPHEATSNHILSAWLELDSPVSEKNIAAIAA